MLAHWYVAKAVKALVAPMVFSLEIQRVYLETWNEVFRK